MNKPFEIKSDCLDIVKRLRAIDRDYFVVRNPAKESFELHNRSQKNSYCLTFPFDTLDERAINLTLKTRVQNADEIFQKIDKDNQKLKEKAVASVLNDFKERMYDS